MYKRKASQATAALFLMFLFLFSTSGSAHAAALAWNTFLGGSGPDSTSSFAIDSTGNIYVSGQSTATWGSPLRNFSVGVGGDAFVAKLSDNGTLIWNTFLGSNDDDAGTGIALDGSGNIYVTGQSSATWGSPIGTYNAAYDAFAAKLENNGALVWNTFLGSSANDCGYAIAIDGSGNIYMAGQSIASWGTPVVAYVGGDDIFVCKLTSSGALTWNTFLGSATFDMFRSFALDSSGITYVAGYSDNTWGMPVRPFTSGIDAFAAKISTSGDLVWNTFLGDSGNDYAGSIAIDASGNMYLAGYSNATWGTPVRPYTADFDVFSAKLNSNGVLTWNTFLGGSGIDMSYPISRDTSGNIYVAGYSTASWGTPEQAYIADADAFVVKLADNGSLVWNTFLGGTGSDSSLAIVIGGYGSICLAGNSNAAWGTPVRAYTADQDAFIAKLIQAPATQASNVTAANTEILQADISWTRGNGEKCAVFMKQTDNGSAAPVDGSTHTANAAFAAGSEIPSSGWFCVYNGTGTSVTVTGLSPESTYRVTVCEYNGPAASEQYNRSTATGNPATLTTLCELNVIPKNLHKLLSIIEPVKVFVLIGSTDTVFVGTDRPVWSSTAIRQLLKLKVGQRIMLAIVFVNPFALVAGEVDVTVANCMGSIEVRAL